MREPLSSVVKRFAAGGLLFLVSMLDWRDWLLNIRLADSNLDFALVLFAIALPHLLRAIAIGLMASAAFRFLKFMAMPKAKVEKEIYRLRKKHIIKNAFYVGIALLPLLFPAKSGFTMGAIVIQLMSFIPYVSFLLSPLLLIGYMDTLLFLEALLVSCFLIHILRILSLRSAQIEPVIKNSVFEEGKPVSFKLRMKSKLPLLSFPQLPFKLESSTSSSLLKNRHELKVSGKLDMGYYRFDVLKFQLASFPFFFSNVYKTTSKPAELTVLPRIKAKNVVYTKNPYMIKESGDLVKRQSGSSLEFSGIREFVPGDPLSKVWWKGLAKSGKMLTKDFYSPSEDRWILVIDASSPETDKEAEENLLRFSRAFIELFTRKDVAISIHLVAPTYSHIGYSSNKRALLSFLIKHWGEFRHISEEGAKEILKDAVGDEYKEIAERCRKSGIS
ncbi:MAG: DUF58 domain-containing protein, partial [Candidatus Altiarchaeota archaeon]|nr:DUF58 domain-containing protein [Candidatus Altiarchaeota archaeon]